jgi:hypothetical protein
MSANPQQDDPFGLLKPLPKAAAVDYEGMVRAEAERQGVDPDLAVRIAKKESGFNPRAIGPVTRTGERAIGLMQLMPDTARKWKVNPLKAEENIRGGISELREQLIRYGSPQLGSAAYNAGPGNVDKHGGVPPFKETKGYVRNVAPQQDAGDPFGLLGEASSAPPTTNPPDWQVVDEGKRLTPEQEQQIKGYNTAHATVQDAAGVDAKTAKGFVDSPHSEQVAHLLPTDEPAVTLHNAPNVPTDTVAIPADKVTHTMVAARPLDLSDIKDKVLSDKVSPEQLTAEINKRIYSDLGVQYNLSPDEVKSYAKPYTVEQIKQALPGIKAELEQSGGTITHRLPGDYERQLGSLAQSKEHEHFIEQIKSLSDDDKELLARSLAAKGALPDDIKQALGVKHSYFTPSALLGTATGIPQDYITTAGAGAEKSVGETLSGVARLNKYNPTADWINGLIDAYGQGLQEEGKTQSNLHKPKGVAGSLAQGVGEITPDVAASLLVPESIPAHIAFWGGLGATKEAGRGGDVGDIAKAGLTNAAMVGAMKPLAPLAGAAGDTAKETIAKLGSRGAMGYAVGYGMARAEGASAADAHASGVQFAAMSAVGGKAEEKTGESPIPKGVEANADTRNIQQDVQTGAEAAKAEKPAEVKEEVKRVSPSDYAAARERILAKRQDESNPSSADDPFGLLSEVSDAPKESPARTAPTSPASSQAPQRGDSETGLEGIGQPSPQPLRDTPSEPTATPEWVRQNIEALTAGVEKSGIANRIEELSAQRKTAQEVASELGIEKDVVRAVRAKRGIPSMDDTDEFNQWLDSRQPPADTPDGRGRATVPSASGSTRFYRADRPDAESAQGRGWAQDPEYVSQKYGKGEQGGESVWHIDVPNDVLTREYGDPQSVSIIDTPSLNRLGVTVDPKLYRRVPQAPATDVGEGKVTATYAASDHISPHLEDLHDQALKLLGKEKPENANPPDINTETQTAKGNADAKAADATGLLEEGAAQTKPTEGSSKLAESLSTGIKKAAVADERTARNESPVEVEGKRTFGDVWERAKQKIDSGESDPASLAKQISEKPRPLSAEESATLIHDRVRLQNAERQTMAQIEEAGKAGNETAEIEARTRLKDIRERLDLSDQAAEKAGYENSLGLSIRRMMAKEDYSLARLEQRARIASGSEVSDVAKAKLETISKQLEDAEKALSGKDARIKELEANRQVDNVIKREQRRASRATTKEALDTEFAQLKTEFATARKEVGSVSGSGLAALDPEGKLTPIILKMAKNRIKAGATTAEQLVDDVFNALKEHVEGLKPRDVRDAISGYGVTAEMSKAEGAARLRELKRQMRLSSALEDAQAGQRPLKTGLVREPESAKVQALKTQLNEALKQQGIRPEMTPEQKAAAIRSRLQADINDLDRRIKSSDFSEAKKTAISTPEIEQLKARRAELKKQYDDLKPEKDKPARDPMPAIKTRLRNEIADLERRFAENDFSKPKKRAQLVYDEQAQVLKARRDALRQQADAVIKKLELANRSNAEKAADFIVKARRAILLSSVGTLGKLTAAASGRLILTPAESMIGEGLSKIPGIKSIAEKAPREGGFNAEAERAGMSKLFSKETLSQAKQVAKTGTSDLDILYGGKQAGEPEAIEVFGRIHGAIKYPAKRAEFFKSLEYRATHERQQLITRGATPEQADAHLQRPDVQASLAGEAYEDAQRAILMNDNLAVTAYRGMINKLKTIGEEGSTTSAIGKLVARGAEFMLPVVKVPTNFVAEASSYAAGLPKAAIQLAVARGVDNLTPKQADYIMRNLKKQTVGAGLMALGYFATQSVGGYYQEGESGRTPEPGTLKLFGVKIPKMLLHTPAVEALQIGATIRRVHDAVMRKGGGQISGFTEGAKAAGEGLVHEVPFFEAPTRATKAGFEKFAGETVRSFIIPPDVQNAARFFDKDEQGRKMTRYPKNLGEEVMVGIPGAREKVAGRAQVERSEAGVLAHKYLVEGLPKPERTAQETERIDMKQQIRESLAKGNQEPLREAKRVGRITEREFDELKGEAKHSEIENDVKRLPIDEAFDVWDAALPDERQRLKPIIREKYLRAKASTPKAQWPSVQQRYQQAIGQ